MHAAPLPSSLAYAVPRLVLATRNAGKIQEFRVSLEQLGLAPASLLDLALMGADETAQTCVENAALKARAAAWASGMPALADDCGFFVEALDGLPGIYLSRFAEESGGWRQGMMALCGRLARVGALVPERRSATLRCALALAWPDGRLQTAQRDLGGILSPDPRGQGVGFEPLFIPHGHAQTLSEMEPWERNRLHPRARALADLWPWLRALAV